MTNKSAPHQDDVWHMLNAYFRDHPRALVNHHLESFNAFCTEGMQQSFRDINPLTIVSKLENGDYRRQCHLYFGGKAGDRIYFGKPVRTVPGQDGAADQTQFLFPNDARLRNLTYGMSVHYDIECEFIDHKYADEEPSYFNQAYVDLLAQGEVELDDPETGTVGGGDICIMDGGSGKLKKVKITPANAAKVKAATTVQTRNDATERIERRSTVIERVYLGHFPIMVQSDACILGGLTRENRFQCGECKNDIGGYFIIDGKEKVVVPQEKLADNVLNVRLIRRRNAVPDDADDEDDDAAAGPDYECAVDIRSVSENLAKPRRNLSIRLLASTRTKARENVVVAVPNVRKPVPLFILFRALGVVTDRDIVRLCVPNDDTDLMDALVPSVHDAEGFLTQQSAMYFIASLTKGKTIAHVHEILSDYLLPHIGDIHYLQKAHFLGYMVQRMLRVWMGHELPTDRDNFKYKRVETSGAIIRDLFREYMVLQKKKYHLDFESRLYFNQQRYEDHLDLLIYNNYEDIVKNRVVEDGFRKAFKGSWGASPHTKRVGVIQDLNRLSFFTYLSHMRKVCLPMDAGLKVVEPRKLHPSQWGFIDPLDTPDGGNIGFHKNLTITTVVSRACPRADVETWLRDHAGLMPLHGTQAQAQARVFVNGAWVGRVADPLAVVARLQTWRRQGQLPLHLSAVYDHDHHMVDIWCDEGRLCRPIFYVDENGLSWNTNKAKTDSWTAWTEGKGKEHPAVIDYLDGNETEHALIATDAQALALATDGRKYTHCEIHASFIFGIMCNQIAYPEHNPASRNLFSCGQSKQACSLYHSNYQVRMDKSGIVLNCGQMPLMQSRYNQYIHRDEHPYGVNAIVAIMCHTGYNVEDAILINAGALQRGLFRTSYYTTYEVKEERSVSSTGEVHEVVLVAPGPELAHLDAHGIARVGTYVTENTALVLLGSSETQGHQVMPKKGQLGVVDRVFVSDDPVGSRIIKVRVLEQRVPSMGDKFASRVGQKGTIGMVIPECDMPFTKDGTRPDIIVNPHALPSRMTVGQLIEMIVGKAAMCLGGMGDCTAFSHQGRRVEDFGRILARHKFHSSGNEIMYDGVTGQMMDMEVFVGPTYYMRLKHMVKDKINYRCRGPNAQLTRQPIGGRANDGGLRVGEMERDSVCSHGAMAFLRESMMERADKYTMEVCNTSGTVAAQLKGKTRSLAAPEGRQFSHVEVPYAFKLLSQELQAMNVQLRVITDDNVHQLTHLQGAPLAPLDPPKTDAAIYGWRKGYDETAMRPVWEHAGKGSRVFREPTVLQQRRWVLQRTVYDAYQVGDSVYYVDDAATDGDPTLLWFIDDLDDMRVTLRRPTETLTGVPYDVQKLRLHKKAAAADEAEWASPGVVATVAPQAVGDVIYGWYKGMSKQYNVVYWQDRTSLGRGSTWNEPEELVRRREILSLPAPTTVFPPQTFIHALEAWELDPQRSVSVADLNQVFRVVKSYWDSDRHGYRLVLDGTHGEVAFDPQFQREVPSSPSEPEPVVGGGNARSKQRVTEVVPSLPPPHHHHLEVAPDVAPTQEPVPEPDPEQVQEPIACQVPGSTAPVVFAPTYVFQGPAPATEPPVLAPAPPPVTEPVLASAPGPTPAPAPDQENSHKDQDFFSNLGTMMIKKIL